MLFCANRHTNISPRTVHITDSLACVASQAALVFLIPAFSPTLLEKWHGPPFHEATCIFHYHGKGESSLA